MKRLLTRLESNVLRHTNRQLEELRKMSTETITTRFESVLLGLNDFRYSDCMVTKENHIIYYKDYNNIELNFICYPNEVKWYCCDIGNITNCYVSGTICQSTLIHVTSLENKLRKILKSTRNRDISIGQLKEVV